MLSLYQKRKIRRVVHSPLFLILLAVPVCFLAVVTWRAYQVEREAYSKRTQIARELVEVEAHKKEVEEKTRYLEDPRGREAELRERYNVAREGERVVVMVEDETSSATSAEKSVPKEKSWWWPW